MFHGVPLLIISLFGLFLVCLVFGVCAGPACPVSCFFVCVWLDMMLVVLCFLFRFWFEEFGVLWCIV